MKHVDEGAPDLVVGWRAIGAAVGRPAQSLAQASSFGKLPVEPIKLGRSVVMTASMITELRQSLAQAAVDPQVRRITRQDRLELQGAINSCTLPEVRRTDLHVGNDAGGDFGGINHD